MQRSAGSFEAGRDAAAARYGRRLRLEPRIYALEDRVIAAEPLLREVKMLGIDLPLEKRSTTGKCANTPGVSSFERPENAMGCGSCCCSVCC